MQNKLNINVVKCLFCIVSLSLIFVSSFVLNGCSGSDDEEVLTQRQKDSIEVYAHLQETFGIYKKALSENETGHNASETFEASLRSLSKIDYGMITKGNTYFWKKDYDELLTSIVQDYFTTQSEIKSSSLLFHLAGRVQVEYEKIEHYTSDREPLPEGSDVPLIRNSAVDSYIEFFSNTERGRSFIDKCLYRSGKFFPLMRKILKFNNAPEELIYLSVQESGLNPTIVSRAGAVGLWQFMPATGSAYGLDQDYYRDDRRDFEKATDAAARHLKDLYKTYDDWYLAFAAYNAGPGRVNKAIKRSGSRDFWTLRSFLPGETKNYVPSILALSFVLRNPEDYGFKDVEYGEQLSYDRVEIKSEMDLQKAAELCETDIETIRDLNPELKNDVIPLYEVPYELRIPHNSFDKFAANYKKSNDVDKSSGFTPVFAGEETGSSESIAGSEYKVKNYEPEDKKLIASKSGRREVKHKLKDKESLLSVSAFYDVRPTDIRVWNNMNYGENPVFNQNISVYISDSRYKLLYGQKEESKEQKKSDLTSSNDIKTSTVKTDVNTGETKSDNVEMSDLIDKNKTESNESLTYESNTEQNNTQETELTASDESEAGEITDEVTENYEEQNSEQEENISDYSYTTAKDFTGSYSVYTVKEGDYLSSIARQNNVSVTDIMEWNSLNTDKIFSGQKLKIYGESKNTSVHTVIEGENLTTIAQKYKMDVSKIIELNGLSNDVIYPGQKLKISGNLKTDAGKNKSSASKKTHKVKKGETLASIASDYNISIADLKKWNNIKSDKIISGQTLKLYPENPGNKKRKNN